VARIPDKPIKEPKREKPVALPKNNTKLSEAKQKMIWKLHTAGRSTREVAALVGCCHASVYKYTVNGKRQWRRTSDEDRKEIIRLRSEGVTYTALAKKFKRSLQTVWGIVNGRLK
jgi:IS30 family transposase